MKASKQTRTKQTENSLNEIAHTTQASRTATEHTETDINYHSIENVLTSKAGCDAVRPRAWEVHKKRFRNKALALDLRYKTR